MGIWWRPRHRAEGDDVATASCAASRGGPALRSLRSLRAPHRSTALPDRRVVVAGERYRGCAP